MLAESQWGEDQHGPIPTLLSPFFLDLLLSSAALNDLVANMELSSKWCHIFRKFQDEQDSWTIPHRQGYANGLVLGSRLAGEPRMEPWNRAKS